MESGSFLIINDVNSNKMGRNGIENVLRNLNSNEYSYIAEQYYYEIPSKIYPGQMMQIKFSNDINANTINETNVIFDDPWGDCIKYCESITICIEKK